MDTDEKFKLERSLSDINDCDHFFDRESPIEQAILKITKFRAKTIDYFIGAFLATRQGYDDRMSFETAQAMLNNYALLERRSQDDLTVTYEMVSKQELAKLRKE